MTTTMLLRYAVLAAVWTCVLPAQELKLIPWPRSVERGSGEFVLRPPVGVSVLSKSEDDRFAAGLLVDELRALHRLRASAAAGAGAVKIGRPGDPAIDAEIARRKLDLTVLDHPESYLVSVDGAGVLVAAKSAEGLFYGVQTLRQLVTDGGRIPYVKIADWPALRYRALSIDLNRGPLLTEEQMRAAIETAAEFKYNMVFFYLEHVFQYSHSPFATPPGGEVTPDLIQRVGVHARKYHVDLVSHQQVFGHLHNMLKFDLYAGMGEIPHGSVLSPSDERTYEWIRQAGRELAAAFPSEFMAVGSDETWELGKGRSREAAERIGVSGLYVSHLRRVLELYKPLGKRFLFPGDIALKYPEMIPTLPKELIAVTWAYAPLSDFSKYIEPFRRAGMPFMICTAVHNWNRVFPAFSTTLTNANNFARDGKRAGAMGMMATHWADDGEALFNLTWYGVVFSAAAAWENGTVDVGRFDRAFDWAFYRHAGDTFVKVILRLNAANDALRSVGEANSLLFWTDPFSRYGSQVMKKAWPVASKVRLLAEQAWVDVAANRNKARRHAGTLQFLQMAARRMDYLGMKIQFTNEIGELYREIQANPSDASMANNNVRRIKGMDGLLPSLRDYTTEVKSAYRDAWLAENRPYWLDNVLVNYDRETLRWVDKIRFFEEITQQYWATRSVPDLEPLGVILP